jgi:Spy/CpxP family protein refolding chaperone
VREEKPIQEVEMKKLKTSVLILFFLALQASLVFAQPQRGVMRAGRSFSLPGSRILSVLKANQEELAITDEQIEQIRDLVYLHEENRIKMNGEQRLRRLELQKLMQDGESMDYDKIETVLAKISAARNAMFVEGLKLRKKIADVLTPDQREALKSKERTGMRGRLRSLRNNLHQRIPRLGNRIRR